MNKTCHIDSKLEGMMPRVDGPSKTCIQICLYYVQKIVVGLNAKFVDLCLLNATKLFSLYRYALDCVIRDSNE